MSAKRGEDFLSVIDASARTKRGIRQGKGTSRLDKNVTLLLTAAESGDAPTVKKLLSAEGRSADVHAQDELGRTPLQLAVNNTQNEVVIVLLGYYNQSDIYHGLMQAIRLDNESTAETIIRHPKYDEAFPSIANAANNTVAQVEEEEGWDFLEISPLVLAAQMEHFGIVQLLLMRGETIQVPHDYSCMCQDCKRKYDADQYRLAKSRLETYKALASEAYVSLAATDPIDYAFNLGKKLRVISSLEKHFRNEYNGLADNLSDYVAKLLDQVNTNKELDMILNKRDDDEEEYETLIRLEKAIALQEKKVDVTRPWAMTLEELERHLNVFVSHASVQKKLVNIWYDELRRFEDRNFLMWLITILWIIAYPVLAIFYWFTPKTKYAALMRTPYLKFLGYLCLYMYLLVIILIDTFLFVTDSFQTVDNTVMTQFNTFFPNQKGIRDRIAIDTRTMLMLFLSIFVLGMLWQEIKQLYSSGIKTYLEETYNYLDWAMLGLYITSLTLYFVQGFMVQTHGDAALFGKDIPYSAYTDTTDQNHQRAQYSWYWNIPDRHMWQNFDPLIVSEGLFAMANVLTFSRISYFMRVSEILGPMQISLGKIISDILKFMVIFLMVFTAFLVGMQNLYWYYGEDHRTKVEAKAPDTASPVSATKFFDGFSLSFRTMFWALFGMGDYTVVEITDGNDGYTGHTFTELIGYILYGCYNVATVLILLNMFIAMMTESYQSVSESSDVEWKFARARLYMDFITPGSTLALPYNIVVSPKAIYYTFTGKYCGLECRRGKQVEPEDETIADKEEEYRLKAQKADDRRRSVLTRPSGVLSDVQEDVYEDVMRNIIKRFVLQREREEDIAEGEMDEIKNDIGSLRYQLLNQLADQMAQSDTAHDSLRQVGETVHYIGDRMNRVEEDLGEITITLNKINTVLEKVTGVPSQSTPTSSSATMSAAAAIAKMKTSTKTDPPKPDALTKPGDASRPASAAKPTKPTPSKAPSPPKSPPKPPGLAGPPKLPGSTTPPKTPSPTGPPQPPGLAVPPTPPDPTAPPRLPTPTPPTSTTEASPDVPEAGPSTDGQEPSSGYPGPPADPPSTTGEPADSVPADKPTGADTKDTESK